MIVEKFPKLTVEMFDPSRTPKTGQAIDGILYPHLENWPLLRRAPLDISTTACTDLVRHHQLTSDMQRVHPPHIPTEIMRTVLAIRDAGSLSKAADRLGLSQPAVTSQVKRLQCLIGGELFVRTPGGTTPTELGKLVIQQAQRMLEANDQLFYLSGALPGETALRLGLSSLFAERFLEKGPDQSRIFVYADHSSVIRKGVLDGYIDVGFFFASKANEGIPNYTVVDEIDWPIHWVRKQNFVLSPGSPIPIVTFPEDDWMTGPLINNDLSFRIVFHSPDFSTRLSAVRAGVGLSAVPSGFVPADLVEAKEYYLPKLKPIKAVLCTRLGIAQKKVAEILPLLRKHFLQECRTPDQ
jgi:DNA-binding transcriptional LysR family regulator